MSRAGDRILRPSPNQNARPAGVPVSAIVLHADADAKVETTLDWVTRPESRVSYHIVVSRSGLVFDVVWPTRRAWHAGVSSFGDVRDVNDFSVGLCLANRNDGREPYPEVQLRIAAAECVALMHAYPAITLPRITTHAVVALPAGRKTDPAPPAFDLEAFRSRVRVARAAHLARRADRA